MKTLLLLEGKKRIFKDNDFVPTPLLYLGVMTEVVPGEVFALDPEKFMKNHIKEKRARERLNVNDSKITQEERDLYNGTSVILNRKDGKVKYNFGDTINYEDEVTFYYQSNKKRTLKRGDEITENRDKSIIREAYGGFNPYYTVKKQKIERKSIFSRIASNNKQADGQNQSPDGLYTAEKVKNLFYKRHPDGEMLTVANRKEDEKFLISIKRIDTSLPFTENNVVFMPRQELNRFHHE
jgi:hypothetical protein